LRAEYYVHGIRATRDGKTGISYIFSVEVHGFGYVIPQGLIVRPYDYAIGTGWHILHVERSVVLDLRNCWTISLPAYGVGFVVGRQKHAQLRPIDLLTPVHPEPFDLLQAASSYELSWDGALHPVYLRGSAYLFLHEGTKARTEFQKILGHPEIVLNDYRGALAHLGLARAYALEGDAAKARAKYQDFFALWKDADPDIPILIVIQA
jgi:hypothetical protein